MDDWTPAQTKPAPFPEPGPPSVPEVTPGSRLPPVPPPPAGFPGVSGFSDTSCFPDAASLAPSPDRPAWKPLDIPPDLSRLGLHVGTSGYQYRDWGGRFYPPAAVAASKEGDGGPGGPSPRGWYPFYQLYFSFLEINHAFDQEPRLRHFAELDRRSKPGMLFSVKVHGESLDKRIWDMAEGRSLMRRHAAAVSPLAEAGRFYSFLIQLDEGVERGRKALDYLLATASAAVSEGLDAHVEFRNRTWHQEAVLRSLQDAGVGICNTDMPGLPHAFPLKAYATTGKAYVRYCGLNAAGWRAPEAGGSPMERLRARNARYDYRYSPAELEERVGGQLLLLKKTGKVAAVFGNHVGAKAAFNAAQDIRLLLKRLPR